MGAAAPPAAIGSSATGVKKRSKKANVNSPAAHRHQRPKNEVQKSNCVRNVPTNKKTTCWNTSFFYWRRHPDLNRGSRICSPMPYHLAMAPSSERARSIPLPGQAGKLHIHSSVLPLQNKAMALFCLEKLKHACETVKACFDVGAGDEIRTRYLHLGKVALCQMSYARKLVPPVGVEPTTRGFSVRCSTN